MLESFWIASSSFLAALTGAVVPGPVFALVLSESLKSGRASGPLIILGHFLIECVVVLMIFMGLQPSLQSKEIRSIIGYVGGVMLIFVGLKSILDALKVKAEDALSISSIIKRGRTPSYKLVFLGFLTSCSNPYFFLWWLTTGLPIMVNSISMAGILGFISFLVGHAAADLSWFSFVSCSVHEGKRVLNEKTLQAVLFGSSLFLIFFAAYIIFSAASVG
ncbi:MAG: LysE family transporter [Candidatus Bathyarchaeia archaeon]